MRMMHEWKNMVDHVVFFEMKSMWGGEWAHEKNRGWPGFGVGVGDVKRRRRGGMEEDEERERDEARSLSSGFCTFGVPY